MKDRKFYLCEILSCVTQTPSPREPIQGKCVCVCGGGGESRVTCVHGSAILILAVGHWWWWLFSSLGRILVECSTVHSPPELFFFLLFLFQAEISSLTLIPLISPDTNPHKTKNTQTSKTNTQ